MLILYCERLDLPVNRIAEYNLRESFAASTTLRVEWFAEYFDFARFSTAQNEANLPHYLRERYSGRKIDLIMPVWSENRTGVVPLENKPTKLALWKRVKEYSIVNAIPLSLILAVVGIVIGIGGFACPDHVCWFC